MPEDEDRKDGPETAASTPSQLDGVDKSAAKSSKDKQCPFCGQAFTSSSLGRHLDLYIKPKNPKPADGVHNVDEIRKMRGGITRRQPRSGARASLGDVGPRGDVEQDGTPTRNAQAMIRVEQQDSPGAPQAGSTVAEDMTQKVFNSSHWQTTGMIHNLPPRSSSRVGHDAAPSGQAQRIQEMRRNVPPTPGVQRTERDHESIWALQEAAEMGRVTELALREVLGSLEAASKRTDSWELFQDVDFFSLSFPGLCLAVLPAPTTLFSPTPFPSPDSWTLAPPGRKQYEVLNRLVLGRLETARNQQLSTYSDNAALKHTAHLQSAYEHWEQSMSDMEHVTAWNLELCRAYSTAATAKQQYSAQVDVCRNRIRHLEAEYDRLSRCQLPRDYLHHLPQTTSISSASLREASSTSTGAALAKMDFDPNTILERWRATIKATVRRNPPLPPATHVGANGYESQGRMNIGGHGHDESVIINGAIFGGRGSVGALRHGHEPSKRDHAYAVRQSTGIEYQVSPSPGQVIGDSGDPDIDADADVDEDAAGDAGAYMGNGSKQKFYAESAFGPPGISAINTNGKRHLISDDGAVNGSSRGSKALKERHAGDGERRSNHGLEHEHGSGNASPKKATMFPGSWMFNHSSV